MLGSIGYHIVILSVFYLFGDMRVIYGIKETLRERLVRSSHGYTQGALGPLIQSSIAPRRNPGLTLSRCIVSLS